MDREGWGCSPGGQVVAQGRGCRSAQGVSRASAPKVASGGLPEDPLCFLYRSLKRPLAGMKNAKVHVYPSGWTRPRPSLRNCFPSALPYSWHPCVGRLSLLQEIFPTQRSNPGLRHCGRILYQLSYGASPLPFPDCFKSALWGLGKVMEAGVMKHGTESPPWPGAPQGPV